MTATDISISRDASRTSSSGAARTYSPSEVEAVLSSHPAVQDIAVVGGPDRIFGEVPIAFVVLRHGADVTQEDLIAYAEKTLSDFKVPRTINFETELPIGLTGKFDKKALKARLQA